MLALIVDDSKAMRMILARVLQEIAFQTVEASHGQDALRQLSFGQPFDLMLVDWNMPGMNGCELVQAVRTNPLLGGVRIMMVTTETSTSQVQAALAAGADEYLMKPFTRDSLLEKLALLGIC